MFSDAGQFRIGDAVIALAFLVAIACVWIGETAIGAEESQSSVVCVEYSGESDKPVLPLIIASTNLSRDYLGTLLATHADAEFVSQIIFPEPDVHRLAVKLRGLLERPESTASNTLLTIARVTVVIGPQNHDEGGGGRITRTLHRADAAAIIRLLERIQTTDAAAAKELKLAAANFRKRTQLE